MHLMVEVFKKRARASTSRWFPTTPRRRRSVDLLGDRLDAMQLVIPPIKGHVDDRPLRLR